MKNCGCYLCDHITAHDRVAVKMVLLYGDQIHIRVNRQQTARQILYRSTVRRVGRSVVSCRVCLKEQDPPWVMHFRFRAFRLRPKCADEANNKHIKVAPSHGNINITLSITFGSALGDHVRIDMFIPKGAICHCLMSCNFPLRSCSYLNRTLLVALSATS